MKIVRVISVSELIVVIGANTYKKLKDRGVLRFSERATSNKSAYILYDSLPQRYRQMVNQ